MKREILGGVKVSTQITPLPSKKRCVPELIIGHSYYISFADQYAYPCTLKEIVRQFDRLEVRVQLSMKVPRKGFLDGDGVRRYERSQLNLVYANEIGYTPVNAIENQVR